MAVIVIKEECNGCEACLASCPYEAIEMVDGVAWINEKCTICLACIEACPIEAIIQEESKVELPDLDKNDYSGIWIFAEQRNGKTSTVAMELLGAGRKLAEKTGEKLTAVLLGHAMEEAARELESVRGMIGMRRETRDKEPEILVQQRVAIGSHNGRSCREGDYVRIRVDAVAS